MAQRVYPVFNTSVLGAAYEPLPRPAPVRIRYVDTVNGDNGNDGLTPETAWIGVKNMVTSATHCPPTGGTRIYVIGDVDLSSSIQYSSGQPNRFVHTLAPGASGAPHEIEPFPGTTSRIINGSVSLRGADYWRWTGFDFDVQGAVGDYILKLEIDTDHFEYSYCTFTGGVDQGVLIETGTQSDIHDLCNTYFDIGNGVHASSGTPGFFDHCVYVKNCERFLSINAILYNHTGGYHFHFFDTATSDPGPDARVLHATSIGSGSSSQGTSGGVVDDGDGIIVANSIFINHVEGDPDASQSGYPFRWINTVSNGEFKNNLVNGNENSVQLGTSIESGTITSNPAFVSEATNNYQLKKTSPARKAGSAWGVLVDNAGNSRNLFTPDLGALEFIPTNVPVKNKFTPILSEYIFEVASSEDLSVIDQLKNASNRQLNLTLNKAGSFSCDIRLEDEICNCLEEITTCILVKRRLSTGAYEIIWSGPIWTINESTPNSVSITAVGWLQTLEKRFITTDLQFTNQDAGSIALEILTNSNTEAENQGGRVFVIPGTADSTIARTRSYKAYESLLSIISGLSEIENGYDLEVDPITRELNIYPQISNDTTTYYEYGVNVQEVSRESDASKIVNHFIAFGDNNQSREATDEISILKYGHMEETQSLSDVTDPLILEAFANAEVAIRKDPLKIYKFTPLKTNNMSNVPRLYEDFILGDVIYLTVNKGRLTVDRQPIRVFSTSLVFDSNGNEQISSIQSVANG